MTPDTSHGKELERDCSAAFSSLYKSYRCRWERTLDTAAAGSIVRSADSDFRLLINSGVQGKPFLFYIECKASKQGKPFQSLFRSLVKPGQNAALHAVRRGGAQSFVLYRDCVKGVLEIWRGRDINAWYTEKRKPMDASPAVVAPNEQLPLMAQLFVQHPQKLLDALEKDSHEVWYLY